MRWHGIPAETRTLVSALPRAFDGGSDGVILFHGFTGTPREMAGLGDALQRRGLSVRIPRLPGHGTNGNDFLGSGWRDWLRCAVDTYADLHARCRRIHLVGHSLGGCLAVLVASRFEVQRLALLAPALRTTNLLLPFTPLLKLIFPRVRLPLTDTLPSDDEDMAVLAQEYWQWRNPAQAASLLKLQRMARGALRRVTADTLVVAGGRDQSVPLSVIPLVEARIAAKRKQHLVFEESTHQVLVGETGERVMQAVAQWLLE